MCLEIIRLLLGANNEQMNNGRTILLRIGNRILAHATLLVNSVNAALRTIETKITTISGALTRN